MEYGVGCVSYEASEMGLGGGRVIERISSMPLVRIRESLKATPRCRRRRILVFPRIKNHLEEESPLPFLLPPSPFQTARQEERTMLPDFTSLLDYLRTLSVISYPTRKRASLNSASSSLDLARIASPLSRTIRGIGTKLVINAASSVLPQPCPKRSSRAGPASGSSNAGQTV